MNSKREIQNSSSLSQSFEGSSSSSRLVQQPFDPGATYKPTPPLGMINTKNDNLLMAPRARNGSDLTSSGPQTAPLPRSKSSKMFFQQQNNASGAGINEPKKNFPSLFFNSPAIKLRRPKSASGRLLIDAFYNVSDEIIVEVFKYLPKKCLVKCAQVSKRWSRISADETLWRRVDMGMKKVAESTLHDIIGRGAMFLRLAKADIESDLCSLSPKSNLLLYPKHEISKLTHLDLSMAVYSNADLGTILKLMAGILERCRCLVALSLEHGMLNIRGCLGIGHNPNLEILNLALCHGLCEEGLDAILEGCRRLREVNVGWAYLTSEMQKMLCTRLPDTMRRLNISGCRADEKALSDDDLEFLICSCPDLTELDISDCIKVTGAGLDTLLEGLDSLAVLNCSRCYGIEPICYTYCTKLKELNMHGCITDEGLKVVGERLGKGVKLCENLFSTIARPTVGIRRTSIWEYRVRDE